MLNKVMQKYAQLATLLSLEISYPQVIHLSGAKLVDNTLFARGDLMI